MIIFVGTFHKTGTVLMMRLFKEYCQRNPQNTKFINISDKKITVKDLKKWSSDKRQIIVFHHHFDQLVHQSPQLITGSRADSLNYRGIIILRHPYEVIMSGMRYHQITNEKWCHQPRSDLSLQNRSYQENLKSLKSEEEKITFEMKNCGHQAINGMLQSLNLHNFLYIHLEDLTIEHKFKLKETIKTISDHLRLPINHHQQIYKILKHHLKHKQDSPHVTNKNNHNPFTFHNHFTSKNYQEFDQLFPSNTLTQLGYSKSSKSVKQKIEQTPEKHSHSLVSNY